METGFETAKTTLMILTAETRIFNRFSNQGYFGRQIIKVSQKSFGGWTENDVNVGFSNKYIFSEEFVEGKKFYLFSKPFKLHLPAKSKHLKVLDRARFLEWQKQGKTHIINLMAVPINNAAELLNHYSIFW